MGSIRLYGSTSGYLELQAPAVAPDAVLTLPSDSVQPGLVHLHTETFSAVPAVSIDNIFSSTYDAYRIVFVGYSSAFTDFNMRLRSGGTEKTTNYASQTLRASSTTVTASAPTTAAMVIAAIHTTESVVTVDVVNPFLTKQTVAIAAGGAGLPRVDLATSVQTESLSFDGLRISADVGQPSRTITGTIRIYGYRNA